MDRKAKRPNDERLSISWFGEISQKDGNSMVMLKQDLEVKLFRGERESEVSGGKI